VITPHSAIAALFPAQAELIDWKMPESKERPRIEASEFTVVFPASTVGRKGCYELREALRGLDVKLITLGAQIESKNFWEGFEVEHNRQDWLGVADLVVLPAFVEHKPRRLLLAAANGIPVIASKACGVDAVGGIVSVNAGDSKALRNAITRILK
jgi:glycosyltransferase involved in cell wall biosynthesis